MPCSLFEFENERFGNVWDANTIEEIRKSEPQEGSGTPLGSEPAPYYCWRGSRIPQWFE